MIETMYDLLCNFNIMLILWGLLSWSLTFDFYSLFRYCTARRRFFWLDGSQNSNCLVTGAFRNSTMTEGDKTRGYVDDGLTATPWEKSQRPQRDLN